MIAVREALRLARAGTLWGCDCHAEGLAMPCEHVLEAADDPALPLILAAEASSGSSGLHNILAAAEWLEANPLRYPKHRPSFRPVEPTAAEPGSLEKRRVLRQRIRRGEAVFRSGDVLHRHRPGRRRLARNYAPETLED